MKTIVAFGLMALFLFVVAVQWRAYHPAAVPVSASARQIYIHGTPVCVFQEGKTIVARVGECGPAADPRDETPAARIPDDRSPGLSLPPGHPPVGPDMFPDGRERRILI